MIVIEIIDIKNFMAHLLLQETFDNFLLFEARAVTSSELLLNGKRHQNWYDSDQWEQMMHTHGQYDCRYMTWGEMRSIVFRFIKGKKSPDRLYIDLTASEKQRMQIIGEKGIRQTEVAPDLRMQIRYEEGRLLLVPTASYPAFTFDKAAERKWEEALQLFLNHKKIVFHLLNE